MKKIITLSIIGFLTLIFARLVIADDFEDIQKRHKDRMDKILIGENARRMMNSAQAVPMKTSNVGGDIIITVTLTSIGDLHRPVQPIAGETYQLLDPRGNIIALIRGATNVPGNMEGQQLQVMADKISYAPGYTNLIMMEHVTGSKEVTPGSILWSRPIDVNEDGLINAGDIEATSIHFGPVQGVDRIYDLNYDGVADDKDINLLKAYDGYNASDAWGGWPDLSNDGLANVHDIIMLADHMGETVTGYQNNYYDLNRDGKIDEKDIYILKAFYGYGTHSLYAPPDTGMPLVEYKNGKIASITFFADDNKTADKYTFDGNGNIVESVHYGEEGAAPYNGRMPLIEYKDGKIASIAIFGVNGEPTDKYMFSADGKIIQSVHYTAYDIKDNIEAFIRGNQTYRPTDPRYDANLDLNNDRRINATDQIMLRNVWLQPDDKFVTIYNKIMAAALQRIGMTSADKDFISAFDVNKNGTIDAEDCNQISGVLGQGRSSIPQNEDLRAPLVELKDGKIASLVVFANDGKAADKYIFDENGRIIESIHYGEVEATPPQYDIRMPLVEYKDGKIASITFFGVSGNATAKYTFGADGKIIQSEYYAYIEPPGWEEPPEPIKPEPPVTVEPINPGGTKPPVAILPRLPELSEPKEPVTGEPITIAPKPPVKEPIKSPVITPPIADKGGSSVGATIGVVSEVIDKMDALESAKTDLPSGVTISGQMVTKKDAEQPAAKSSQ